MRLTGNSGEFAINNEHICVSSWELTADIDAIDVTCQSLTTEAREYISNGLKNIKVSADVIGNNEDEETFEVGDIVSLILNSVYCVIATDGLIESIGRSVEVGDKVGRTISISVIEDLTEVYVPGHAILTSVASSGSSYGLTFQFGAPQEYLGGKAYVYSRLVPHDTGMPAAWENKSSDGLTPPTVTQVFLVTKALMQTNNLEVKVINEKSGLTAESAIMSYTEDDILALV